MFPYLALALFALRIAFCSRISRSSIGPQGKKRRLGSYPSVHNRSNNYPAVGYFWVSASDGWNSPSSSTRNRLPVRCKSDGGHRDQCCRQSMTWIGCSARRNLQDSFASTSAWRIRTRDKRMHGPISSSRPAPAPIYGAPNPSRGCATPWKTVARCAFTARSLRNGTHAFQIIAQRLSVGLRNAGRRRFETIVAFHRCVPY